LAFVLAGLNFHPTRQPWVRVVLAGFAFALVVLAGFASGLNSALCAAHPGDLVERDPGGHARVE
jgi:hypothetical protein